MSTTVPAKLVLGLELAGMPMTPEEFDAVEEVDRNYRYELIGGRLVVTPPALEAERGPNEELGYLLRLYRETHPQGTALDDTLPEQTVPTRVNRRRADRILWIGLGRQPNPQMDLPQIVVEFVSGSGRDWRRDYVEKRQEYGDVGIVEYWIIDRFRRTLTVYRREDAGPRELVLTEQETYRTPLLPGFELPLARLLAVADRWRRTS